MIESAKITFWISPFCFDLDGMPGQFDQDKIRGETKTHIWDFFNVPLWLIIFFCVMNLWRQYFFNFSHNVVPVTGVLAI